jgi:diguanylate cyclase (GGDEF)-like protein
VSSIHIYGHTINNIKQSNRIELLNNSLRIIADHDRMTRLNNRYALERRIPEFLDKDICVAMLDINKFKAINDTYGHLLGDEVLKLVADKMLEIFPRENIFRYGGDEFLAIEPNNGMDKFMKKFKRLNKSLVNSHIGKYELTIQCCYGCVSANVSEPKDFMDVISQADKKLYAEKQRNV